MPFIKAKSIEDAKKKFRKRYGKNILISTTKFKKEITKFQKREYGVKEKHYYADYTKEHERRVKKGLKADSKHMREMR